MTADGRADGGLPAALSDHRRELLGVAYRLLGSVAEAEDAVQETWVRAQAADPTGIADRRRWLIVVLTRICLDVLRSARVQRERYIGEWLPEPFVDPGPVTDPADRVTLDESVNLALLVVLESLSPAERTAFVLHDVFGLPFTAIADAVGRSPAACRQLAARARAHIDQRAPRFDPDPDQHRRVVSAFVEATEGGDLDELVAVLDPDVVLRSDGGGRAPARRAPLRTATEVAAFILWTRQRRPDMVIHPSLVNGRLGIITTERETVSGVVGFAIADGRITEIDLIMNPDKLQRAAAARRTSR
jgi:RNA polymerase sigma-70 factor (ECF subfamily)